MKKIELFTQKDIEEDKSAIIRTADDLCFAINKLSILVTFDGIIINLLNPYDAENGINMADIQIGECRPRERLRISFKIKSDRRESERISVIPSSNIEEIIVLE